MRAKDHASRRITLAVRVNGTRSNPEDFMRPLFIAMCAPAALVAAASVFADVAIAADVAPPPAYAQPPAVYARPVFAPPVRVFVPPPYVAPAPLPARVGCARQWQCGPWGGCGWRAICAPGPVAVPYGGYRAPVAAPYGGYGAPPAVRYGDYGAPAAPDYYTPY
jgi:hypothetical protein